MIWFFRKQKMYKFLKVNNSKVVSLLVLSAAIWFAVTHKFNEARATTNPSGLTSKYGCVMSRASSGFATLWQGHNGIGINSMVYLDFSTNTGGAVTGVVNGYNTSTPTSSLTTSSGTFTETAVPDSYNSVYLLRFTDSRDASVMKFLTMPVNSGNTLLFTEVEDGQQSAPWNGVCQKI